MKHPFFKGALTGALAPIMFLGMALAFVFKATGKVPFAIVDDAPDQVTVKLIEPEAVPEAWKPWGNKLESFVAKIEGLGNDDEPEELELTA